MNAFLRKVDYVVDFLSAPEIFCGYDSSLLINPLLFFFDSVHGSLFKRSIGTPAVGGKP